MNRRTMRVMFAALLAVASGSLLAAELVVSAAASLTNVFGEIGKAFESSTEGRHKVVFNFGASGSLLQQISRGAPVDVFASADSETMERADKQSVILRETRRDFAANRLVVAVPLKRGLILSNLQGLLDPSVQRIAIGTPESVPVGRYAKAVLDAAGLWATLRSKLIYGQSVRQCLDYLARGEVDAGFVYATDAHLMADKVRTALVVPTQKPVRYPIAVVKGNGQEAAARAFVDFVLADPGARRILAKHGFLEP